MSPYRSTESTNEETAVAVAEPVEIKPLINDGTWVATASSQEAAFAAPLAIDGFMATRWSSEFKDNQWWMVDFGREERLARINLNWEDGLRRSYKILLSTNQTDWVEVFSETQRPGRRR